MTRWLVLLGLFAGCSFTLSGPEPHRPRGKLPDCSTSKTTVVADGLFAALSGVLAISLASSTNSGAAAVAPLAIGALFTGAAIHGNSLVNDCRRANDEYLAEAPGAPAPIARTEVDEQARALRPPSGPAQPVAEPEPQPEPEAEPAPAPKPQPPVAVQPAKQPPPPPASAPETWGNFWKEVR